MSKKKKFVLENVLIESYAAEGKCIARHNEKIIFVEGAVPGDRANLFVFKNKKDWAEARVNEITTFSSNRITPFCEHFNLCGGCKWQMLPYVQQLVFKEQQVKDQLKRIGKIEPLNYLPIIGCEQDRLYRNKLEFTFSTKQYLSTADIQTEASSLKNVLGFHAPRLFDKVIDIEQCHLQHEPTNAIKNFIRQYAYDHQLTFHDIRMHHGLLRNLMIRVSSLNEVMINLVFGEDPESKGMELLEAIKIKFPEITSLQYTVNKKMNDTIYDQTVLCYSGKDHIIEQLEEFKFRIGPKSFFQTNSKQAEVLYGVTRDFAECTGKETLYDLYCGTGSIGIFLSPQVNKIIGVEAVDEAIEDAKKNATLNGLSNTTFYSGDVIKVCDQAFFDKHGHADVVIIDPPRAGCHEKLLEKLLEIRAPIIVYVSCNPATQARDLQYLSSIYSITKSQAVDMFPQTHHIENVVQLKLNA
ncbi:MAG: 23S rRNA (uracil(1939)-C(5))-methyltransferase RlmD [Chitinophagaceae bacterium]|nr:23S rRNA (uracil(1939)-C(5))-methyltransferase RlmD [Chitinophagaceae bacterium]